MGPINTDSFNFALYSKERLSEWARDLKKEKSVLSVERWYGLLDGILFVYSNIKFVFDYIHYSENSAVALDDMHDWMMHPVGTGLTVAFSCLFMYVSQQGNICKKDEPISIAWKYMREIMQALRNNLKAIKASFFILGVFLTVNMQLLLPISLAFGVLYMLSRVFFLQVKEARDQYIKVNRGYLEVWKNNKDITWDVSVPASEHLMYRYFYLMLKTYNGALDSLYLYVGVLILVPSCVKMTPVLSVCLLYALLCVASRVYEEYLSQKKLEISAQKIKFLSAYHTDESDKYKTIFDDFYTMLNPSYFDVFMLSIKDALPMQGFVNAFLLTAAGFSSLLFGVGLSASFFSLSMTVGLLSFIIIFMDTKQRYLETITKNENKKKEILALTHLSPIPPKPELKPELNSAEPSTQEGCSESEQEAVPVYPAVTEHSKLSIPSFCRKKLDSDSIEMILDDSSFGFFKTKSADYAEVARSGCASGAKARKFIEFVFNFLQEKNPTTGHYQDTTLMTYFMLPASILYFMAFTGRAIIKGFYTEKKIVDCQPPPSPSGCLS